MKTYFQTVQYIKNELAAYYPEGEISGFISIIFTYLERLTSSQLHLRFSEEIKQDTFYKIGSIIEDLKNNIPIQYIIGETEFYGLKLYVSPGVLIPRPETEELVDWIIEENKSKKDLSILDIGTGSGCIAIALSKNLPSKKILGLDLSRKALQQARKNNIYHKAQVILKKEDIFKIQQKKNKKKFDIVVSNPPYVTEKEKVLMHCNVLNYEPHMALFVENENPLKFFQAIAIYAKRNLHPGGQLFFEINEFYSAEVFNLLIELKFNRVIIRKDIHGKDRMVMAVWQE